MYVRNPFCIHFRSTGFILSKLVKIFVPKYTYIQQILFFPSDTSTIQEPFAFHIRHTVFSFRNIGKRSVRSCTKAFQPLCDKCSLQRNVNKYIDSFLSLEQVSSQYILCCQAQSVFLLIYYWPSRLLWPLRYITMLRLPKFCTNIASNMAALSIIGQFQQVSHLGP